MRTAALTKIAFIVGFCAHFVDCDLFALGQAQYVESAGTPGRFPIVQGNHAATIYVDPRDWPGVIRAVNDLQADIARVTDLTASISEDTGSLGTNAIIIGTIGKSQIIDDLISGGKIDPSRIAGKWESFFLEVVPNPLPDVISGLVIVGSDKRGTIYGIYDLSEQMGVSPWYWWADVPVQHQDELFVKAGKYQQGEPSVKYRGIFLNDEAPDLAGWVAEKFGTVPTGTYPPIPPNVANFNSKFYARLFEVILRLKGNYLWPAMLSNAFNEDDPENPRLADEYGIVMGTSHQEPMLRAQQEWDRRYQSTLGHWNYAAYPSILQSFWRDGIRRNKDYESIITIGLRGANDTPMIPGGTVAQNIAMLEQIVDVQRQIIAEELNPDVAQVPQLWCLYKEVQVHIGYASWQDPPQNNMPQVTRLQLPAAARMGVSIEGSMLIWPDTPFDPVLPKFDVFNQQRHYIDVFNRGQSSFRCTATPSAPWILVHTLRGAITKEERIWVTIDWRKAPKGSPSGTVTIARDGGEKVSVTVEVFNPKPVPLDRPGAFVEADGYVSMEAEHYTSNIPADQVRWEKIEGYGRTLSAMSIIPVTSPSVTPPQDSPCLEYGMDLFDAGSVYVVAIVAPSLNFVPGRGLRYAVSFDDQPPQIITIVSPTSNAGNGNGEWEESVRNASRKVYSGHTISDAGYHTLKIWMVDPAVVLEKIMVDLGGLKGSYLGPPESYRYNGTISSETNKPLTGSAVSRETPPPLRKGKHMKTASPVTSFWR